MATVSSSNFRKTLSQDGGSIDLNNLSSDTQKTFKDQGVDQSKLKKVAGQDGVIRGKEEMKKLFSLVDDFDKNGSSGSLGTTAKGKTTKSGAIYGALKKEADASRTRANARGAKRFNGDKTLDSVSSGKTTLSKGAKGDGVKKVQQALVDMGYTIPGGASGTYDKDTKDAVKRFQREVGLGQDGVLGSETLGALKQTAPSPGKRLERSAEYDKLYADGRLDTTIAIGYDEKNAHVDETNKILKGLKKDGYKPVDHSKLSDGDKKKLGLTKDRYDPNAQYFHKKFKDPKSGKDIDNVVRLITPGKDGKKAQESFKKAVEQDEVVLYSGHARYGTGPDFDHIKNGDGNFVVNEKGNKHHSKPPAKLRNAIKGRGTDLDKLSGRPKYQLMIMNACSTEEYLPHLRGSKFKGRDHGNTDIVVTNDPTWVGTGAKHTLGFLKGVTQRQTQSQMTKMHNKMETDYSARLSKTHKDVKPNDGYNAYSTSGFFGNSANREVPR